MEEVEAVEWAAVLEWAQEEAVAVGTAPVRALKATAFAPTAATKSSIR